MIRYSTAVQMKANNDKLQLKLSDATMENRIDEADRFIRSKLSNLVDFTVINAMATPPDWLNCLSQYLGVELALVLVYGAKRDITEVSDIKYWHDKFWELLNEILTGQINLGTGAISKDYQWDARRHVAPAFGQGDYSEYKELEELQEDREYDTTG